jgi:hypothetical protein
MNKNKMEKTHLALWQKIAYFNLDDSKAELPFSQKLMAEQKWSLIQTQRTIAEYKKFMFLVIVEPNGASPAKMVDEVWHSHITFTQNYAAFCEQMADKFIHHHPSKGGKSEINRHADWYKETLIAYIRHFDAPPPPDIWDYPYGFSPELYLPENSQFSNPDTEGLEEMTLKWQPNRDKTTMLMTVLCGALLLLYFGNPFTLSGPKFLIFYGILAAIGLIFNFLEEIKLQKEVLAEREKSISKNLSPLSLAWLMKGDDRFFQTALVQAMESKVLNFWDKKTWTYNRFAPISETIGNPLITTLQCIENKESVTQIPISTQLLQDILRPSLTLVTRQLDANKKRLFEVKQLYSIWIVILVIGVIRLLQGLFMGKAVLFLFLLILAVFFIKLFSTSYFETEIADFVEKHTEKTLQNRGQFDAVMRFAHNARAPQNLEFNSYILFASLATMSMKMPTNSQGASSCGGSSCGSDGGGSCSGGSSCGGGGCGGGGCGGCGG